METIYYDYLSHEQNRFLLAVSQQGLAFIDLLGEDLHNVTAYFAKQRRQVTLVQGKQQTAAAVKEVKQYLTGARQTFTLALDFGEGGTAFQREVWQALCRIPYGQSQSYSDLALGVKRAKASRAVGTAVGLNPLPIVVPCHRILRKDKTIGGYSGGVTLKASLLELEGIPYHH